jgi:glutamate--cysteine ligase catalytic subunit
MGLLSVQGHPLSWPESLPYIPYVKEHGIQQFLHIYNAYKDRSNDLFFWGDEVNIGLSLLYMSLLVRDSVV